MRKYLTISVMTVFIIAVFFVVSNAAPSSNSNKNGWKFLTWGMSINETNTLLVKNGMKPMKNMTDSYNYCEIVYGNEMNGESFRAARIECFNSDLPSHYGDDVFSFYFVDNKLDAVAIRYENYSSEYMDTVIEKLRNNFPSGTIEEKGSSGKYFSYVDNNIVVHNRPDRHRNRHIWYINPDVIKIKNAIETLKKREEKESEDRREKLF